ncbi:S1 RNA-binding domain-containing protein [Streptomyces lavendulocolor]|uniref:S1 RNA-binding domain-containing protein n=1 Tax=Streptomyces lavendulocolor TaxID=67316 RepID=UPI0031E2D50A
MLLTAVLSVAAVAARRLAGRDPAAVPPSPYTPAKQGKNDMTRGAGTAAGEEAVEIRDLVVLRGEPRPGRADGPDQAGRRHPSVRAERVRQEHPGRAVRPASTRLDRVSEPVADPRLRSLADQLRPGAVRTVKVTGFDGADVLVELMDAEGEKAEIGRIPGHEVSMRRVEHPSELFEVGQEIDAEEIGHWCEGELHLSARACEIPALRSFLLAVERGQVVTGTVAGIHDFGVFVHLDGEPNGFCTGFIRVPDLTWGWIDHPSEAVEAGQRITAEVIITETRSGQVTLSLKALREDPLIRFVDQVGCFLTGPIIKILPFGVLVQLARDVVGFLHLSEMADESIETPDQLVDEGGLITVRVTAVDLQRRRVRLGAAGGADGLQAPPRPACPPSPRPS